MYNNIDVEHQKNMLRVIVCLLAFPLGANLILLIALINNDPVSLPVLISILALVLQGSAVRELLDLYDELNQSEQSDRCR